MKDALPKSLQCWRPLKVGQRIVVRTRWNRGNEGTVYQKHDDRIDGMARYSVHLDNAPHLTTDFVRCELGKPKPRKKLAK